MSRILKLDAGGTPQDWISHQDAVIYHAKNLVAWQLGEGEGDVLFRGGENRITGKQSRIVTAPIIVRAISGSRSHRDTPCSCKARSTSTARTNVAGIVARMPRS